MQIHHWPYWALIALVAGILAPFPLGLLAILPCLQLGFRLTLGLALLLSFTSWRCQEATHPLTGVEGQTVEVVGIVSEPAVATARGSRYVVDIHHWLDRRRGFEGRWLVESPQPAQEVALGDWWALRGKLVSFSPPAYPGDWDGARYWGRKGVCQRLRVFDFEFLQPPPDQGLWSRTYYWRQRLTQRLADRLPAESAAILCAVVYGDGSRLTPQMARDFRLAGVSHLLVASGTNVALLIACIYALGAGLGWGPVRSSGLGLWLVPLYVGLTGASPSMLRAGAMGWLALLARWTGHTLSLGRSLTLGSLGVLLWDPLYLYDVGFQLSFGAVASLAWLTPWCQRWLPGNWPGKSLLAASLACTLGLSPISIYVFRIFQPLSPIANLWMGPLVEGLLPLGLLLSALDLVSPDLGDLGGQLLNPWLWFVNLSVQSWARWSPTCEVPDPGLGGLLAWLWVLALVRQGPGLPSLLTSSCLCLASLCLALPQPDGFRARALWLGNAPALWILEGRQHLIMLCQAEQLWRARRVPLAQGYGNFDHVFILDGEARQQLAWGQGWLEINPDSLVYHRRGLNLGLGRAGLTWSLARDGHWAWQGRHWARLSTPLQLVQGSQQIWLEPWKGGLGRD